MSAQYLNSVIPNQDINIKCNDIYVNNNIVANGITSSSILSTGFITSNNVIALANVSSPAYYLQGGLNFTQFPNITTTVDASSAKDSFKIITNAHNLTHGATVQFDVNVNNISEFDNVIISMYGFSGSYLTDGTPICFIQDISPTFNRFTIGIKNIAVSENTGVGNNFTIQVTIIRGLSA